jgi:hypothetical protein
LRLLITLRLLVHLLLKVGLLNEGVVQLGVSVADLASSDESLETLAESGTGTVVLGEGRHDLRVTDDEGGGDALVLDELADELGKGEGGELKVKKRRKRKEEERTLSRRRALVRGSEHSTLCCTERKEEKSQQNVIFSLTSHPILSQPSSPIDQPRRREISDAVLSFLRVPTHVGDRDPISELDSS